MKTNEFRLGNIVEIDGIVREIIGITPNAVYGSFPFDQYATFDPEFKVLSLNEQWLERLGFRKTENSIRYNIQEWRNRYAIITVNTDNDFLVLMENTFRKECEFVHQLQNLYFALTGEELKLIP